MRAKIYNMISPTSSEEKKKHYLILNKVQKAAVRLLLSCCKINRIPILQCVISALLLLLLFGCNEPNRRRHRTARLHIICLCAMYKTVLGRKSWGREGGGREGETREESIGPFQSHWSYRYNTHASSPFFS